MAQKITEMGYKAAAVVGGKFFDCETVYTLREIAEMDGVDYDADCERNDKELVSEIRWSGFAFLGVVKVKEELKEVFSKHNGWEYALLVRGRCGDNYRRGLYLITEWWDEARGRGKHAAYRFNILASKSWEYNSANYVYNKAKGKYKKERTGELTPGTIIRNAIKAVVGDSNYRRLWVFSHKVKAGKGVKVRQLEWAHITTEEIAKVAQYIKDNYNAQVAIKDLKDSYNTPYVGFYL